MGRLLSLYDDSVWLDIIPLAAAGVVLIKIPAYDSVWTGGAWSRYFSLI